MTKQISHHYALSLAKDAGITRDNILCLDVATKTGWATSTDSGNWKLAPTKEEKKDGITEYWKLMDILSEFLDKHKDVKLVVMEDVLSTGGNAIPNKKLAEYHGIVKAVTTNYRLLSAIEVPYYSIKYHVTKNGNATKQQVIDAVKRRTGHTPETDDEADAIALYLLCARELSA